MASSQIQRIQDCVHGLMEFRGMEGVVVDLLRTPELQRLRKIRQLGLAHLVFPGAEHSRLIHSLGAAFIAIRFGRHISENASRHFIPELCPDETTVRDLGVAALCHDLGHGPFSHAWEREIVGEQFDRDAWAKALGLNFPTATIERLKWHEMVGHSFLLWEDGQLHTLLEQHERGASVHISNMLLGEYYLSYLPRLLASDIDVDRADFLRRDAHQTGVTYGRYDLDWLISTCAIGVGKDGKEWLLGFDERKAIRVMEQFLIARRALYETVYHHKTVRCAEGMMALFLRRLKNISAEGLKIEVASFVRPVLDVVQGEAVGPDQLLKLDDFSLSVLIDQVAQSAVKDETVRDLAKRIQARDLFKQVPVPSQVLDRYFRKKGAMDQLYEIVRPFTRGEAEYYIVFDEVRFGMLATRDEERACLVDRHGFATFADLHPAFEAHKRTGEDFVRLFTIREARQAVAECILGNA